MIAREAAMQLAVEQAKRIPGASIRPNVSPDEVESAKRNGTYLDLDKEEGWDRMRSLLD
jgi:hypothetical protein